LPDLLILDLMMPDPDGYAILDRLALRPGRDPHLPILILTGDSTPLTRLKALSLNAKDFLIKPVDSVDLSLRVHNLIETRLLYNELARRDAVCCAETDAGEP